MSLDCHYGLNISIIKKALDSVETFAMYGLLPQLYSNETYLQISILVSYNTGTCRCPEVRANFNKQVAISPKLFAAAKDTIF